MKVTALSFAFVAFSLTACSRSSEPVKAAPASPAQNATPAPEAKAAADDAKSEAAIPAPAEVGEPPRDEAGALKLVDQGRTVQREKGEGGADEAIALYQEALKLDPKCGAAYWELGWSFQVQDKLDEALAAWKKLKEIEPDYPELDKYLPVLEMRHDHKEKLSKLPDPGQLPEPELEPRDGPTVRFAAVGDVQTGRGWPEHRKVLPPNDATGYFDGVKDWLQDADVTFGNLEEALADDGESSKCGPKSTKCFAFRVPTSHAKVFKDAGFDMMSIANNHAGDFGQAGRDSTMKALTDAGIAYSGPVGTVATVEHDGLRIGMVAVSTGGGTYRIQEIDTMRKVVADVDRTHDIVVVSFHGGAEGSAAVRVPREVEKFYGENRGDVYAFSHAMIDAGADLVFGHGPHVLRGMELYKGRLIAYSLGNFSTYKTFNLSRNLGWSTVLQVEVAPNGVALNATFNPVRIVGDGTPIKDTKGRALEEVRRLSKEDFGDPIFDAEGLWHRPEQEEERSPRGES